MKKFFTILLMTVALASANAQVGTPFGANMFMSAGGGLSFYQNDAGTTRGFYGGISAGKWILEPLAFRLGLDIATVSNPIQVSPATSDYVFISAEFLWDFMSTFSRIRDWRFNAYPLMGLGVVWRDSINYGGKSYAADHEAQLMLGMHTCFKLGKGWDIFAEYKCNFFPQGFDFSDGDIYMHSATVGFTRRFTESPFYRRTAHESRGNGEDWFVGVGIGPNYSSFDLFSNPNHGGLTMIGVAPEVMFGRNFSNFWTIRFELTGLTGHEIYDTLTQEAGDGYTFTMLHADLMMNLSHAFKFERGVKWSFMPYLGAGAIWRYDNAKFDMGADFGLFARRYLSREGDLFIDLKYIMVPPRIGGSTGPSGSIFGVGLPSLTVGYIHNFGQSSTRYRMGYPCAD